MLARSILNNIESKVSEIIKKSHKDFMAVVNEE